MKNLNEQNLVPLATNQNKISLSTKNVITKMKTENQWKNENQIYIFF